MMNNTDLNTINAKLDKIIELLEAVAQNTASMRIVDLCSKLDVPQPSVVGGPVCNCDQYLSGTISGGWYCPVHGQCF